ncbi:arginase family protein [Xenorhabdus anantnagensis]|uniref:Arginase family protein n=1 Tax=Xenorhabdus anantnagensis TaxID=3025875 RepID=A0ABT5LRP1_9GAMM|nr:arginase family protein [Xenorhabdus anantnagensis]MDC9597091.1 arginase family protein [Xenorhabdus anantnagensis]
MRLEPTVNYNANPVYTSQSFSLLRFDMFSLKLDKRVEWVTSKWLKCYDNPPVSLPAPLQQLANLSREWYSVEELQREGISMNNIESLLRARLLCFGLNDTIFPVAGRSFYEEQFPDHAAAYPVKEWFCGPLPINTIWVGLPFCHLTNIRHSTALGLASIIDQLNGKDLPFLGVFPFMNPTELCIQHLCQVSLLASHAGKRLGVLGGDHRVAWAILKALRASMASDTKIRYIHIDAHHDLYGSSYKLPSEAIAHSNFLLSLLAEGTINEAFLIGCRDNPSPIERAINQGFPLTYASEYHPILLKTKSLKAKLLKAKSEKIHTHLSVDIDILDPSIVPNVCSPINGGWSLEKLINMIRKILQEEVIDSVSLVEAGTTEESPFIAEQILSVMSE